MRRVRRFCTPVSLGAALVSSGSGIAVDLSGNAHVVGTTQSPDFPTANALQAAPPRPYVPDTFVSKLNATGSAFVYSTYFGMYDVDFGSDIAVDVAGSAYITGTTVGSRYYYDAFVTKLNSSGSAVLYS